jgi:hypothetical protein
VAKSLATSPGNCGNAKCDKRRLRQSRAETDQRTGTFSHSLGVLVAQSDRGKAVIVEKESGADFAKSPHVPNAEKETEQRTTDRHVQPLWLADNAGSTGRDGDF